MFHHNYHLSRIVKTAGTDYQFIWDDDGFIRTEAPTWTGFFRGVEAGTGPNGDYSRYDTMPDEEGNPKIRFTPAALVVDLWVADGGVVEDYVPPEEPAEPEE